MGNRERERLQLDLQNRTRHLAADRIDAIATERAAALEEASLDLQPTQSQLVEAEKLSALKEFPVCQKHPVVTTARGAG